MTMTSNLYSVRFKPSVTRPVIEVLCQAIELGGQQLLWLDGLDLDNPLLLPMSAARSCESAGSFHQFILNHYFSARDVLDLAAGQHSVTLLARAIQRCDQTRSLTADEALNQVIQEARDILYFDQTDLETLATASKRALGTISTNIH